MVVDVPLSEEEQINEEEELKEEEEITPPEEIRRWRIRKGEYPTCLSKHPESLQAFSQ